MYALLLALIYLCFISLGLPDALLGSAWPQMRLTLGAPLAWGGFLSLLITCGTILSSLASGFLLRRFSTGRLTAISVAMTAAALWGFSVSRSFPALCLWCIPYGLGAGCVDAGLNHFVALRYEAKHMNWLHCFWGIGATAGPLLMGQCLSQGLGWQRGYGLISGIQILLAAVLLFSLPVWKHQPPQREAVLSVEESTAAPSRKKSVILPALTAFFLYSAVELTTGLWGSSFLTEYHGLSADTAAQWISLFYLGITLGRLGSGFLSIRLSDDAMIRLGEVICLLGILALLLPLPDGFLRWGLLLTGLGCAPIYPAMLHATPKRFGTTAAQSLMGVQMACSYLGCTLMPPLTGLLLSHISMGLFPAALLVFLLLMAGMSQAAARA
ncbi:MFS transporter [Anaerotignum lactatifermentans]|uniref:MFS transporter n=1 Tax=Anaerotignum lactatifermentans TaxID=160404 RepID=A0ABS2GAK8_9FIRM|nr:MFS transporter [Anaerotignum lactatifermentans]MBM6828624.1 MFS transporter [Anaerotignum lactatifermentans]MBM6878504.1 MFS transporter [Anaerotignum lactatifermentans]MBM6950206.1 MFS transporter [Anaerotignum lactatifermentans]